MIKYIINNAFGSTIYKTSGNSLSKKSNLSIIKDLCIKHLFTYEGYLKACKKIFNKTQLVPVYISPYLQFLPTKRVRDYENIWINFSAIKTYKKYENNKTKLIFKDNKFLIINMRYHLFEKNILFLEKLKKYKVKPFHKRYH